MAKKEKRFKIAGRVIDRTTRNGVRGLRVEAWDKDLFFNDLVGNAITDEQGSFQIEFDESYFRELFLDRRPDLFFKVFQDGRLIHSTEDSVLWNVDGDVTDIVIECDFPQHQTQPNRRQEVRGKVLFADGFPAPGLMVTAFNRNLRTEQELGKSRSDKQGSYRIYYSEDQLRNPEAGGVDLIVKVFTADGSRLAVSPVLFNAPPLAELNLTIPVEVQAPPPLFEKLSYALEPLLGDVKVQNLEEANAVANEENQHRDLSFLAGETGFEKAVLARFVLAHKLAQANLPAEFWFVLLGGSVFRFAENKSLAEQFKSVTDSLAALAPATVRKSFVRSFNQNEVSKAFQNKTDDWLEAFLDFVAVRSVSDSPQPTFLKLALEDAGIQNTEKQESFARLFNEHKALTPELLQALAEGGSFKEGEIANLQTSFRLAEMTQGQFSLVKAIKEEFGVRQPEQIRTLAKIGERQWVDLVKAKHAAGEITLPIDLNGFAGTAKPQEAEVYGRTLARRFREAFPTTAFAGQLAQALSNGGTQGLKRAEALGAFLERHEDFEFLNTNVDEYLKNGTHPDFKALASDDDFRQEMKATQRVFKLHQSFEATNTLLADNIHSAQQVYRLGESQFVQLYADRPGFDANSARVAWNRAADTHAATLTIVADLKALDANSLPQVLQNNNQALSSFPNWENLFQTGDLCDCEACRSVLSPAAYFADLLIFLRDRKAANPAFTVKEILFRRRPDLGYLELNCENALTPLPYIDVVCEVLENVIAAGDNDVELVGLTNIPDTSAATKTMIANALQTANLDFGADFSLSKIDPLVSTDPVRWVIHGDDRTYLLKKQTTPNFFAEILRNTKTGADELRAYPQYVNPKAYDKLRQAKYPIALPFDLFAEEVRSAIQKTNLQRWDLMTTFRGATAPNNPTNGEIAAEYFGISANPTAAFDEKRLILVADTTFAGQQIIWGESGNPNWLNTVGIVKNFLQKTGLEYNDLLTLLDLKFINPAGNIAVVHLDASCDTEQKVIQVLDQSDLDRIHRFLRLWRKLKGWKMWEVDLVIRTRSIGNGALDESFLINLFYVCQLKNRLGGKTTVEQMCSLFSNHLNTETRFTKLHEKREEALYQRLFLNRRLINPLDPAFELDPVTGDLPAGQTITAHQPVVVAALGLREPDLLLFKALTRTNGSRYINDDLTLSNLSFLWQHSWYSKLLKFKAEEWKLVLKICDDQVMSFDPRFAWHLFNRIDQLKATGFSPDELNWLLAADRSARAATKEADAARFLSTLRKNLQAIAHQYDPTQYDFLATPTVTDVESLTTLLTSLLQQLHRDDATTQFFIATLRDEVSLAVTAPGLPVSFDFPPAIKTAIRIRYDEPATTIRFTGLMTAAERTTLLGDPTLAAVTGIASYQVAIEQLFKQPRLALKFFEPVFSVPLTNLPAAVDFKALLDPVLAQNISYNPEERSLRYAGILSQAQKDALDTLSADAAYRNAVNSLFTQPATGIFPAEKIWLLDSDLLFPLRDLVVLGNDNLAKNLAKAVNKALAYLLNTQAEEAVVQSCSAQLGLTPAVTYLLLTRYARLPDTLLKHFTAVFAATTGVVDYATLKLTFDGWYWANRVATILKKWKLTLPEWERLIGLAGAATLTRFLALPLDDTAAVADIGRFLRTCRLVALRDSLPETNITFFEVLERLAAGSTKASFATDVEHLNPAWSNADVAALIAALDLIYPADYLLAENWDRLRRAFYFCDNLNAGPAAVKVFAAAAMSDVHAKTLKELLRSKFGAETWLTLSAEIQDVLRERKRDALAAYWLTQNKPADAPSGKWENTNDLYAYYLLDVEMSSCQLTSRLVQASGSVQLFVQRCFMGLEPDVAVKADGDKGDSAWHWWKWMRKYRVWEANRKVFLWPENWIEPELRKDKSQFFLDLENELLQNEIDQYNMEAAFENYLEKLDGVAQLEVVGFFHEDAGDNAILHLFGRTTGAEPHIYYYRRYDYRQWTPWEKVELDIQGDYLIPAVVANRLYLFWPVFKEVPDEVMNSRVGTPGLSQASVPVPKTVKKLELQMAVSEYRKGKWTPKRVSTDVTVGDSYDVAIVRKYYRFFPIDRSEIDGRFGIKFDGYSLGSDGKKQAFLSGAFEITGCKGVPELTKFPGYFSHAIRPEVAATGYDTVFLKWVELGPNPPREDDPQNDFSLESDETAESRSIPILTETPWFFSIAPPWHLSYFDKLILDGLVKLGRDNNDAFVLPVGSWLPFFYNDKKRTFFALPTLPGADGVRKYYPEIKKEARKWEDFFAGLIQIGLDGFNLGALLVGNRGSLELALQRQLGEERNPPYTDQQLKDLLKRYFMGIIHWFMGIAAASFSQSREFHFKNFYHPFVCDFAKLVSNPLKGIPAMMSRETQLTNSGFSFRQSYVPTQWVVEPTTEDFYPAEVVDFTPDGAYSPYNWELFFHAPLLIANTLSKNQRFEEARDWYHFIFNPIGVESSVPGGSAMSKYWITKKFFETADPQYVQQRIDNILRMLAGDPSLPGFSAQAKTDLEDQVLDWRTHPFEPHRIASYRTVAYQKTTVMKYLDNLIAWGDYLFRQDSMESINEATQLYILAAELLGRPPRKILPQAKPPGESFNELEKEFDRLGNALVEVENLVPPMAGNQTNGGNAPPLPMLYFCIPQNDKMLGYWDTVADRLYKIRHCMNIEGVVRQLALFEPPIDPAALVKAVAAGLDIGAALADLNAPLPLYRFNVLLQKANEVCNDVKGLGGALLAALEKKDGEALGLLRQAQEMKLLDAVKSVRETQVEEAKDNLLAIQKSKVVVETRRNYYRDIERLITQEKLHLDKLGESHTLQEAAQGVKLAASIISIFPAIDLGASGFGGSPLAKFKIGGLELGQAASLASDVLSFLSQIAANDAAMASSKGSFDRRWDDWKFQERVADRELEQFDVQIAAAELRVTLTEKELDNQILQIENAKATDAFMRSKYTNQELYQWQLGQISGVYFQSYKLAYDLAKRAERCFRFELGLQDSSYINFGYWDSLKKGLLSGEKLQYDLRRLEAAYLQQNQREFELTKHVSLWLLAPLALIEMRETGQCVFELPEELFDLDYSGHYFRRIKSVSVTLPCVAGPYTTISCTLRLQKSSIRINTANGDNGYPRNTDDQGAPADDVRFIESNIPVKAIATSSAQNDSGVFELNFRDDRYLPFEGAGVISRWSMELFTDLHSNNPDPANPDFGRPLRQFDYRTISDAIVHIKYAAREDAGPFKNSAVTNLRSYLSEAGATPSLRLLDLRQEFPGQWSRFLIPTNPGDPNVFGFEISPSLFQIKDIKKTLKINTIWVLSRCTDPGTYDVVLTPPLAAGSNTFSLPTVNKYGGLHFGKKDVSALGIEVVPTDPPVLWQLQMTRPGGGNLQATEVEDLILVLGYQWE